MHQFTFLCSVAEVNEVQSWARAKNKNLSPQQKFCRKLVQQMMENTLNAPPTSEVAPVCIRRVWNANHSRMVKKKLNKGSWNPDTRIFKIVNTEYLHLRCQGCQNKCRTYCSCDHLTPLCTGCYALHCKEVN